MRNFAKIYSTFWTGKTGRQINSLPEEVRDSARILGSYLFSSPFSSAVGLYQLPLVLAGHHTAKTPDQIRVAMGALQELDFAEYDEASEFVWVKEMANSQLSLPLKYEDDKRVWVARWWLNLEENPFIVPFYERYKLDLHLIKRTGGLKGALTGRRGDKTPSPSPSSFSISKSGTPSQSQTQTPGKGDRGETHDQELEEIWVKVLKAAGEIFSAVHMAHIRANRLVRIDKRGIYVVVCPSKEHLKMMEEYSPLMRKAAHAAGVQVSRFCWVQKKKTEEVFAR